MMGRHLLTATLQIVTALATFAPADELRVLDDTSRTLLHAYLMRQMHKQYDDRRKELAAALESKEAIAAYQQRRRVAYRDIVGVLPERTPLEPQVVGKNECDGYRIKKVIYQSRPGHRVTGNLYLPSTGKPPYPGVVVPCGHSHNGKAAEAYQALCRLLARNGLVALCYDPIGQGERHQIVDLQRHGTSEHTLLNIGSLPVGRCVMHYRAWDAIRSIDYILSRPEVDRSKPVGMTGNSGGGMLTIFMMGFDDRILPAAPGCAVIKQERKFETLGVSDGCQHIPGEGAHGLEKSDYLILHAPKPTLILAAEQDFVEFAGTQAAYREVAGVYRTLGVPDSIGLASCTGKHGLHRQLREASVQWMRRWLLNDPRPVVEPETAGHTDEALRVTRSGQVVCDFSDEVTVQAINLSRARALATERERFWKENDRETCLAEVRRLIALRDDRGEPSVEKYGTVHREGYSIDKLVIRRENEIPVPALLFLPRTAAKVGGDVENGRLPATVYVDARGKAREVQSGGEIEQLVRAGRIVLNIDVRGYGETTDGRRGEYRTAMLAMHVGRPLLGQRVEDTLAALDVLAARDDVDPKRIELVGVGSAGSVALHAAALDRRIAAVTIRESIRSWIDDVVAKPDESKTIGSVVPGALLKYDLPDLVAAIAPRRVRGM